MKLTNEQVVYLTDTLRKDEGTGPVKDERLMPYRDAVGKLTIGYGRNLQDRGISKNEADMMLVNDIADHFTDLLKALPWVEKLDWPRQYALLNMAFNMGLGNESKGLLSFKRMLQAIREGRYADAAAGIRASLYARQTGPRAARIAQIIETGVLP